MDNTGSSSHGFFLNAGPLFTIAKQAHERVRLNPTRSHESTDPLVAIVFSVMAAEAVINELEVWSCRASEPPEVQNLGFLLSEIEVGKGSLTSKFLVARFALTGKPFDKGRQPFQDFATLVELRNTLVHTKMDRIRSVRVGEVDVGHPGVLKSLRSAGVLADFGGERDVIASWMMKVSTPATAAWACNATASIVRDLVSSIPESSLRRDADLAYFHFGIFDRVS